MDDITVSTLVRDFTAAGHIGTMGIHGNAVHRSMVQRTMNRFAHVVDSNRFVRLLGRDCPATQVLNRAVTDGTIPVSLRLSGAKSDAEADSTLDAEDYTLLDPALTVWPEVNAPEAYAPEIDVPEIDIIEQEDVRSGTGYAGMTPQQRSAFLAWLVEPSLPALPAYQELYLANLEVRLFEGGILGDDAHLTLRSLQLEPAWRASRALERSIALSFWLRQDGSGLASWLTAAPIATDLLTVGLGMQALLSTALTVGELAKIGALWDQPALDVPEAVLNMRLASLTTNLGADPLAYALNSLDETDRRPQPWRCAHRDLRISLPQLPIRSALEPVLIEMASIRAPDTTVASQSSADLDRLVAPIADANTGLAGEDFIILEFGQSRSEYFDYVLQLAQRQSEFTQLMDEDRRLVYRTRFRKDKLRSFWRIWEYVQNWSAAKVYVNGEEIEHWKIWPYSQYLR
jgi:hypothetical protein